MITIRFPDGSERQFEAGVTASDIAKGISTSLAKRTLVAKVNGQLMDLTRPIIEDAELVFLTKDDTENEDVLELLRHDAAHVLAEAVKELFPETQVTIGPAIENGFYYDFYREESFTPEDLITIEKRMREIVQRDEAITREVWDRDEAVAYYKNLGEDFKAEIIGDLPAGEEVTFYRQGEFLDLCRGPHLPSTGKLGTSFKLMKLAGAYWRGDSSREMLQRVYGTAWANQKQLDAYVHRLEEAEKRDHRKLGKELDLFHFQEEAKGTPFWHPKGWTVYRLLQELIRDKIEADGYEEINTPELMDKSMWEKSGHWDKFRENMFLSEEAEGRTLCLKPMSCPGAIQVFNQGMKSYRDLPIRLSEFGHVHRNEASGALHGLLRVRAMTQDDGHVFCTEEQILDETKRFCNLLKDVYKVLGFEEINVKLADRPETRAGDDATWDKAEEGLKAAIDAVGIPWTLNPGDGAFYGPKLEFYLKDAIGRAWQCGTLQLDFVLPERLGALYVGEDGQKHHPVLLHRAVLGTLERFMGILIENHAGKFPLWLSPIQVVVTPITSDVDGYAEDVCRQLRAAGLRVEMDLRSEKINFKVRDHSHKKIPVIVVVGKREAEEKTVALRYLGSKEQDFMAVTEAIEKLQDMAKRG